MDSPLRGLRTRWGKTDNAFLLGVIVSVLDGSKTEAESSKNTQNQAAFLGNYAESSSPPKTVASSGSVSQSSKWDADAQLAERYALQIQARKSLLEFHYSLPDSEKPKKAHRVCNCRRDFRPVHLGNENGKNIYEMPKQVSIFQHKETKSTFYGGLVVCGSGYACPVDAPKISEKRSSEIRKAVSEHVKNGGICLFITLTFPHYACDTIKASIDALRASFTAFRSGKRFSNLMAKLGYIGLIRGIETTWGESNGWHPHSHEIWFVSPDFVDAFKKEIGKTEISISTLDCLVDMNLKPDLFELWKSAVMRSGLSEPSLERGMFIRVCETEEQLQKRLADYLAKTGLEKPPWGVDDELTKLHSKKGKFGRLTPFDFLREQYNPEKSKADKFRLRCLFSEYVNAFKGVAKIYWSPGLKKIFQIKDITDKQAAEEQTESAVLLMGLRPPIWVFVIGINDHRAQLLTKIKNEGVNSAKEWLKNLLDSYADYFPDQEKFDLLSSNHQYILNYLSEV